MKKKFGGYVKKLNINKFWSHLNEEEKTMCREAFAKSFYPETIDLSLVDEKGQTVQTDLTATDFYLRTAIKLIGQKHYNLAEKLLETGAAKEKESVKKHLLLTELLDLYYKQRAEKEDAIEKCMHTCKKDMELAVKVSQMKKDIPSFKRLAIILENEEKYTEAIHVSEAALTLGLTDGTKGGYEGRIAKLKNKLVS